MLFREMTAEHLARRLVLRGWPKAGAKAMAEAMCNPAIPLPRWEEVNTPDSWEDAVWK